MTILTVFLTAAVSGGHPFTVSHLLRSSSTFNHRSGALGSKVAERSPTLFCSFFSFLFLIDLIIANVMACTRVRYHILYLVIYNRYLYNVYIYLYIHMTSYVL